ncbi:MAG: SpoIIE family protein phosphatase, partial [Bacteroidetes bacterium]|nr:SpoIIE family protein phosphatase [Bacteroidota bacterium]
EVTNTGDILNNLRTSVIDALKQTAEEGTQKDGMDMSIVAINKDRKRALWSGANNPLYINRKDPQGHIIEGSSPCMALISEKSNLAGLLEIKADKMPVAVHINMEDFTNHEINIEDGVRLFLFTDGYPDQFGGPKGKKFKYKAFKKLIAETSDLRIKEQGELLENELNKWMNWEGSQYGQIDDITVVGLKI